MRLGEDLLHAYPFLFQHGFNALTVADSRHLSSISDLVSRGRASPTGLSSTEAEELMEKFREVHTLLTMNSVKISDSDDGQAADASISPVTTFPRLDLWLRLYAHALLRESQIFPGIELCAESPGCSSGAFADIWKGDYRGEPVCVKVIRTRQWTLLKKIWVVCGSYFVNDVLNRLHIRYTAM